MAASALLPAGISAAATNVELGTAGSYGILGASTVTNTGPTTVWGDLGVHPGTAVTGFDVPGGPGIVGGAIHAGDAVAEQAQSDALLAYDALDAQSCAPADNLTGQDLGGLTLTPGVYCFDESAQLTGALTLNALADPGAVFIFRTGSTLTTASASSVQFTNSFASCNVFWQIGSSATLGTATDFVGTVIARASVSANTDATVEGRLIALEAAVTLQSNVITRPSCPAPPIVVPPADEPPVGGTPVGGAPVGGTPRGGTDGVIEVPPTPGSSVPGAATPEPVVPVAAGPAVPTAPAAPVAPTAPVAPGGPAGPGAPPGPAAPRPPLAATGSGLLLGGVGLLCILVGLALVSLTHLTQRDPLAAEPVRLR